MPAPARLRAVSSQLAGSRSYRDTRAVNPIPNPFMGGKAAAPGDDHGMESLASFNRSRKSVPARRAYVTLGELSLLDCDCMLPKGRSTVPAWAVGCWQRRSITYASNSYLGRPIDSLVDDTSFVVWLQTSRRCGDLRLMNSHPAHPSRARPISIRSASHQDLRLLARGEGWLGCCRFDTPWRWSIHARDARSPGVHGLRSSTCLAATADWFEDESCAGLPTTSKWPELGEIRRVGEAIIEFAPSGQYVEDWRLLPGSDSGLMASLVLLEDSHSSENSGTHLLLCGNHAVLIRDRPRGVQVMPTCEIDESAEELEQRVDRLLAAASRGDLSALASAQQLLDFECSYASREGKGGAFRIMASTLPERVGDTLPSWHGTKLDISARGVTPMGPSRGVANGVAWTGMLVQPSDCISSPLRWGIESWNWIPYAS